jgi:AbrB family looped-hinge helix DNA binding protein
MLTNMTVSERGQITLPKYFREKLGILKGGLVTIQDRDGRLEIAAAAAVEVEIYTEAQAGEWAKADELSKGEKKSVLSRLARLKK